MKMMKMLTVNVCESQNTSKHHKNDADTSEESSCNYSQFAVDFQDFVK